MRRLCPFVLIAFLGGCQAGYRSYAPGIVQVEQMQSSWEIVLAVLTGASTVVVAIFAAIQLRREHTRSTERRNAAEARLSVLAYMLRRQLRSWLGLDPDNRSGLEGWLRGAQNSGKFGEHIDRAERAMVEMLAVSDEASDFVSNQLRLAAVYFLAGANRLNHYADTRRPNRGSQVMRWAQLREDAEREFKHCLDKLEAHVIKPELLRAEKTITEKREEEDPMHRFEALVDEHLSRIPGESNAQVRSPA